MNYWSLTFQQDGIFTSESFDLQVLWSPEKGRKILSKEIASSVCHLLALQSGQNAIISLFLPLPLEKLNFIGGKVEPVWCSCQAKWNPTNNAVNIRWLDFLLWLSLPSWQSTWGHGKGVCIQPLFAVSCLLWASSKQAKVKHLIVVFYYIWNWNYLNASKFARLLKIWKSFHIIPRCKILKWYCTNYINPDENIQPSVITVLFRILAE